MQERIVPPPRWAPDVELTVEGAAAAIAAAFPELAGARVVWLGAGWDNDVYAAGDWVFRFPRRREVAGALDQEARVLATVASALDPLGVRVPVMELRAGPAAGFPHPFSGARRLSGVGGDRLGRAPAAELPRQLGRALAALHAIPAASLPPLESEDPPEVALHRLAACADAVAPLLPEDLRARCAPWLAGQPEPPPPGAPCVIHDDVADEHVWVDPERGTLTGLIDFADTALGDPALDFVGPTLWLGWERVRGALEAYAPERDPGLRERVVFLTRVQALRWLHEASLVGGGRQGVHVAWVRRAFEDPALGTARFG